MHDHRTDPLVIEGDQAGRAGLVFHGPMLTGPDPLSQTRVSFLLGRIGFFLLRILCSPNALAYCSALLCIIRIFPCALKSHLTFFSETLSELSCAECAQLD